MIFLEEISFGSLSKVCFSFWGKTNSIRNSKLGNDFLGRHRYGRPHNFLNDARIRMMMMMMMILYPPFFLLRLFFFLLITSADDDDLLSSFFSFTSFFSFFPFYLLVNCYHLISSENVRNHPKSSEIV